MKGRLHAGHPFGRPGRFEAARHAILPTWMLKQNVISSSRTIKKSVYCALNGPISSGFLSLPTGGCWAFSIIPEKEGSSRGTFRSMSWRAV